MPLFRKNYSNKTDEELISLLTQGGQSAFDELYVRYSKQMFNFFFRMFRYNREKAEDMLHDLFLKIIEKPESFDRTRTFGTWFYTLAGNMVKNEYRNSQVRTGHEQQSRNQYEEAVESNVENMDKQLFNKYLHIELDKLPPELKTMFNMRFIEEMSVKQIAEMMECPEGTVKSRLFYLTRQLSKKLSIYKLLHKSLLFNYLF
jgi:RNA polymerase sigma-70 factor (ECF subfamily)